MAYVVARPKGRFEIRESVHTPKGPRARTLANFGQLTGDVLRTARGRATRPFDADAVRRSAAKAGAPLAAPGGDRTRTASAPPRPQARRFVEASRRMARSLEADPVQRRATRRDPGDTLIDLLDFVAQVRPYAEPRPPEPLTVPPLATLAARTLARRQRAR